MTIIRPDVPELSRDELGQWQGLRCKGLLRPKVMDALDDVIGLIAEEALASPAISYCLWPASGGADGTVHVGSGKTLRIPPLTKDGARVSTLAVGVCTIGPKLEARVREFYREGRHLRAMMLDEAGNVLLYALSDILSRSIRSEARTQGLQASSVINPGDAGFPIQDQSALYSLADASTIGVRLTGAGMLSPEKSLSAVIGLGVSMPHWSRAEVCARCKSREKCRHSNPCAKAVA